MPDLSRYDDVLALIRDHAATTAEVRLVVVGGSAATGRYDQHSDLDVELWVDGPPDATYDEVSRLLAAQFGVDHVSEVLRERWPVGTRQLFAHLQPDSGDLSRPTRIVDLAVHPLPESGEVVIDPRRHGLPIVLHDPDALLHLGPEDEARHEKTRAVVLADIAGPPGHRRVAGPPGAGPRRARGSARVLPPPRLHAAGRAAADGALPGPPRLRAALPRRRPPGGVRRAAARAAARARSRRPRHPGLRLDRRAAGPAHARADLGSTP